jgi:hypothetical protein
MTPRHHELVAYLQDFTQQVHARPLMYAQGEEALHGILVSVQFALRLLRLGCDLASLEPVIEIWFQEQRRNADAETVEALILFEAGLYVKLNTQADPGDLYLTINKRYFAFLNEVLGRSIVPICEALKEDEEACRATLANLEADLLAYAKTLNDSNLP